ncbi:alanyl-tRNA synthetase [Azoarcus sp. Aa7]|nr:alanyl-tRNA synthetase [Azoarcus sp. Aa7]
MTEALFRLDAYARSCVAQVVAVDANRVVLDRSVFYPTGGGQPGDCGVLIGPDGTRVPVVEAMKGEGGTVVHVLAEGAEAPLNALVAADTPVEAGEISETELDANPGLVKTMSVQPPRGQGSVRTIHIPGVDLQPCGGTHLRRTGEVGPLKVVRIRSEGKRNKRVTIAFAEQ